MYCSRYLIIVESSHNRVIFKKLQKIKSYCSMTNGTGFYRDLRTD
jgi:hypothetical protein